jgi:hypothetical protein
LQFLAFLTVTLGWRGSYFRFPIVLVLRRIPRALRMSSRWPMAFVDTGEMAMDYDWLWLILAVGVLAPVGVVPFALVRDACCWWREHRRGRREREMAGRQLWEG